LYSAGPPRNPEKTSVAPSAATPTAKEPHSGRLAVRMRADFVRRILPHTPILLQRRLVGGYSVGASHSCPGRDPASMRGSLTRAEMPRPTDDSRPASARKATGVTPVAERISRLRSRATPTSCSIMAARTRIPAASLREPASVSARNAARSRRGCRGPVDYRDLFRRWPADCN
jgi:hypothetical protein